MNNPFKFSVADSLCVFSILALGACKPTDKTYLSVNVCLEKSENIEAFKEKMRLIASANQMKFIDSSEQTNSELSTVNGQAAAPQPFVFIGIDDEEGNVVMGGNMGLTNRQVALGFREGRNPKADHAFANHVVSMLKNRWRVEPIASDEGAFPMNGC